MNTRTPRPSFAAVAVGVSASKHGALPLTAIHHRQHIERDIQASLERISRLALAGHNPGFPVNLQHRLRSAARAFTAPTQELTLQSLNTTCHELRLLADEASAVKMLEGAA